MCIRSYSETVPMKRTLLFSVSIVLASTASAQRELPVIADRVGAVTESSVLTGKGKSLAFVAADTAWNLIHGDLRCNDVVYTLTPQYENPFEEQVYVGGAFDSIDGVRARGLAYIDYGNVSEIGGGISDGEVYAIATDHFYNVYVAGNFKKAGNVPVNNIAHWDGTSWHDLGGGTDSTVLSLYIDNAGTLYAGGNFRKAGGLDANYAATWSIADQKWSPIVVDSANGLDGGVAAIVPAYEGVFMGGGFTKAGKVEANKVVGLINGKWENLGEGVSGVNAYISAISSNDYSTEVTVGGSFSKAGSISTPNIALYRPATRKWEAYGAGLSGTVHALTTSELSFKFNAEAIACGEFVRSGTTTVDHIAVYREGEWGPLGSGLNGPGYAIRNVQVSFVAFQWGGGAPLYVGGEFTTAGDGPSHNLAIHYSPQPKSVSRTNILDDIEVFPNPASDVLNLSCASPIEHIEIRDVAGRLILRDDVGVGTSQQINISNFVPGLYTCILRRAEQSSVAKFIIKK